MLACPQGPFFFSESQDLLLACPQGPFFSEKNQDLLWACPQGPFFSSKLIPKARLLVYDLFAQSISPYRPIWTPETSKKMILGDSNNYLFWKSKPGVRFGVPAGAFFFSKSQDLVLACPQGPFFSQKARIWLPQGSSFKIDGGLPLWVRNLLLWSRNLPLWTRNLPLKVVAATAAPTLPSTRRGSGWRELNTNSLKIAA